jgi:hypothetical protein
MSFVVTMLPQFDGGKISLKWEELHITITNLAFVKTSALGG